MKELNVGLIMGRHQMPVKEYIFDSIEDVLDFDELTEVAVDFFRSRKDVDRFNIYITGLTTATLAIVNGWLLTNQFAAENAPKVVFFHYDRDADCYAMQYMAALPYPYGN